MTGMAGTPKAGDWTPDLRQAHRYAYLDDTLVKAREAAPRMIVNGRFPDGTWGDSEVQDL